MISWGTRYRNLGTFNGFPAASCPVCSNEVKAVYHATQGYFTIFSLPLFPTQRQFHSICPSCNCRLMVRSDDPKIDALKAHFPSQKGFRYYWGWIFLFPVLALILGLLALTRLG